jgi:ankyrin repeat protein
MSDPLSVAAGVIAIIGAVEVVRKELGRLTALRHVPDVVHALSDEVRDLHCVLRELETLAVAQSGNTPTDEYLRSVVLPGGRRIKETTQKLERLIEYQVKKADGRISKASWLRLEDKVLGLQKELRHSRIAITTALGVLNTASISRLETRLDALQLATERGHTRALQTSNNQTQSFERLLLAMADAHKQSMEHMVSLEDLVLTRTSSDAQQPRDPLSVSDNSLSKPGPQEVLVNRSDWLSQLGHFSSLRMRFLQRRRCNPYCSCACHRTTRLSTPRSLQFLFGTLLVGYSSVPKLTAPCTSPKCSGKAEGFVSMSYYFPRWIVSRVVAAAIQFAEDRGPEFSISSLRVRDSTDLIFTAAAAGDAITVRRLLEDGQASVVDVASGTGHTPLHLAVMRSHVDVIFALLQFGAEALVENATQETPYDMAWSTVLCFEGTPFSRNFRVEEIKGLFPSVAALEERRTFSRIHQIVLKLICLDLETELKSGRSAVDTPDSDGRTALHWAAGRGDEIATSLLLQHGANPDHADRIGQGPLRSSLKASDPNCMKLLLAYGANIMQTDHWGQTCLQAAMYYSDPVGFGKPLLEAGIDMNAQDCQKSYALLEAVRMKQHDALTMLLDSGADPNIADSRGATPLLVAVSKNDHTAIRLLLRKGFVDATARDDQERNLLHYAAEHADITSLESLTTARLEDLDVRSVQKDGLTAIEIAETRWSKVAENTSSNEKCEVWVTAFTSFLDSVVARTDVFIPPFKDEEDQLTEYFTDSPADSIYLDAL